MADCVWPEQKKTRDGKKRPDAHSVPPGRLARREQHRWSTYQRCSTPLLLRCCRPNWRVCECISIRGSECAPTQWLPPTSPSGRLACGGRGTRYWSCSLVSYYSGQILEGRLACFARRARGPSWCHADRLPGLLLSTGLMAHKSLLPGLVMFSLTTSSVVTKTQTQTFTHSIFHSHI